jgi:hypothetical protein
MTPKEKAQELDSRFYELVADTPDPDWRAKQGALIAVDEIIEIAREAYDEEMLAAVIIYWSKVKQEIEKL